MSEGIVVNHVGQCVTDLARSRRFYEHVLGFEFWREVVPPQAASAQLLGLDAPLDSRICYLRRDGFVLELFEYAATGHRHVPARRAMDEPGLTHLSVACEVATVCTRVGEFGGEVLSDTDVGSAVFIRDPDGQLIELLPLEYAARVASL
jgi:lactoylglutathione lyase